MSHAAGQVDDRHHSAQEDETTHIVHCTLIILTIIHSGQGLFCCSTLSPVLFINMSLLLAGFIYQYCQNLKQFVLEALKWCCRSLLFVKQVLKYTRVKLLEEASQSLVLKSQESRQYEALRTLRNAIHKSKGVTYSLQKFITPGSRQISAQIGDSLADFTL